MWVGRENWVVVCSSQFTMEMDFGLKREPNLWQKNVLQRHNLLQLQLLQLLPSVATQFRFRISLESITFLASIPVSFEKPAYHHLWFTKNLIKCSNYPVHNRCPLCNGVNQIQLCQLIFSFEKKEILFVTIEWSVHAATIFKYVLCQGMYWQDLILGHNSLASIDVIIESAFFPQ